MLSDIPVHRPPPKSRQRQPETLIGLISASARVTGSDASWSRAELLDATSQWHSFLDEQGCDVVAIDLGNGCEWVALSIALFDSGRTAVPLPSFFSATQRQHALDNSGARLVICNASDDPTAMRFRGCAATLRSSAPVRALPNTTALVTYTSGSTGEPKGACLSADSILSTAQSLVSTLSGLDVSRHLCVLPLTLLLENVAGLFANLINGSEVLLPELAELGIRGSSDIDVATFGQAITRFAPDSIIVVPQLLLGLTALAEFGVVRYPSLRFVAVGGGRVTTDLLQRAEACGLPVFEGYGLTECVSVVALNTPENRRLGTVGKLLPHVQADVIGGELVVRQPRMLGYVGATESAPQQIETGDLVELDGDGFLTVHGRKRNVFITSFGRNVAPEWLEAELQSELCIGLALVNGEASATNTALVLPRGTPEPNEIKAAIENCNSRLPDYGRISRWFEVSLTQLTKANAITGNGRLKRTEALFVLDRLVRAGDGNRMNTITGDPT